MSRQGKVEGNIFRSVLKERNVTACRTGICKDMQGDIRGMGYMGDTTHLKLC